MFPLRYDPLTFLRPASEVIIQACSLLNQALLVGWKALNGHGVFDVWLQALIELGYLSSFIPIDPGRILGKPGEVLWYRCLLSQLHEL